MLNFFRKTHVSARFGSYLDNLIASENHTVSVQFNHI